MMTRQRIPLSLPLVPRLAVAMVATVLAGAALRAPSGWAISLLIALLGTVAAGYPLFIAAYEDIRAQRVSETVVTALAIVVALVFGQGVSAVGMTAMVLAGQIAEDVILERGRRSLAWLVDAVPPDGASLVVGGSATVLPNERIPVDGYVVSGTSFVDESLVTGNPTPVEKVWGTRVFAGTVNRSGTLEVRVERVGPETAHGRILATIEASDIFPSRTEEAAALVARYMLYAALGIALVVAALKRDANAVSAVLAVAGVRGLTVGVPLAMRAAIARAARSGAIVKARRSLPLLAGIGAVAFEKNGILTRGMPEIVDVVMQPGFSDREVLGTAAFAEARSDNPLGRAIRARAKVSGVAPTREPHEIEVFPGLGVVARTESNEEVVVGSRRLLDMHGPFPGLTAQLGGDASTDVYVARGGQYLGRLRILDPLREEAKAAIRSLNRMNVKQVLLSADSYASTASVARALGIEQFRGDLTPDEKRIEVSTLRSAGTSVAVVGDATADAPALAAATVGFATNAGADVTRDGDVALIGEDLMTLVRTFRIARLAEQIAMQNTSVTIALAIVGFTITGIGILGPIPAAFVRVAVEFGLLINASRTLPPESSI